MTRAPILVRRPGHADEQTFRLRPGPNTVGRTLENDIVIANWSLSRRHARIDVSEGEIQICDLGSKNGTYLRGVRVNRGSVNGGDELRFGDERFLIADEVPDVTCPAPRVLAELSDDLSRVSIDELLQAPPGRSESGTAGDFAAARWRVLLKSSQLLNATTSMEQLLQTILELALSLSKVERASLLAPGSDGRLAPLASLERDGFRGAHPLFSRRTAEAARERSAAVLFSDVPLDSQAQTPFLSEQAICAAMCVPLKSKAYPHGLLYVDSMTVPRLSLSDLELLSGFAQQAEVAMDQALLRQRLQEDAVVRGGLSRFLPPLFLEQLSERKDLSLAVREADITALYLNIRRFDHGTVQLPASELAALFSQCFSLLAEIVFECGGILERYLDGSLLAIWGAPVKHVTDAERALEAAVRMQCTLSDLSRRRGDEHASGFRIALHSGNAVLGNIGTERNVQFAALGSAIDRVSQVCGATPPRQIWMTETTLVRLALTSWSIEEVGPVDI